jgi:hypothetical protein
MLKSAVASLLLAGSLLAQSRGQAARTTGPGAPHPVRNNIAQPGEEIVTIRYFRIRKGTFDHFLKASQEDVWPFFDKIGARVIGMWKVFPAEGVPGQAKESPDYDEVYLSTRYASHTLRQSRALARDPRHGKARRQRSGLAKMPAGSGAAR